MKKYQNHTMIKQRGLTLIELMITLGIAALLIGVAVVKAPTALASYRSNAEIQEFSQVITNTQKAAANAQAYTGFTLDTLVRLDVFPRERVTIPGSGAATANNRWGGAVTFASGTINTTGDIGRYVHNAVPASECKSTILGLGNMARRVYVDGANSGTVGAGTIVKADGAAVNEATVATACSGTTNSITYDIAK